MTDEVKKMSTPSPQSPGPTSDDTSRDETEELRGEAARSSRWMMLAMIACCAAIPVALLITALAGGLSLSSVSGWSWALLAAAVVAAAAMIVRVGRPSR